METILAIMASGIRFSIPYTLAGLGGTYSERSGVVNIGLEGMMLIGAFTAVAVSNATGSAWLGLLAAIFAGMLLGVIHGVVCVTFKADQIVSGLAIIIFAAGITVFFAWLLFNQTQIKSEVHLRVPLLHDIPAFKVLFSEIQPMVFLTALVVIVSHFIIFKTVFGLRLRAVGEHPQAADTLGISVDKMHQRRPGFHRPGSHDLWKVDAFWNCRGRAFVRIRRSAQALSAQSGAVAIYRHDPLCADHLCSGQRRRSRHPPGCHRYPLHQRIKTNPIHALSEVGLARIF
jgi:hypothetical protein